MVTVEVDAVSVESRLSGGQFSCPACPGLLRPWGWARSRRVHGIDDAVRPRRARCDECLATHVLLPVNLLARRGYTAELVVTALVARAAGRGHRPIAAQLAVPSSTVRGWLRRMSGRLEHVRARFTQVVIDIAAGVSVPTGAGTRWRGMLAALGAATAALRTRFGARGRLGTVTAARVAVALSNGLLLAPGWPGADPVRSATPVAPAALQI